MISTRTTALVVVAMCVGAMLMFGFNKWNGFGFWSKTGGENAVRVWERDR